MSSSNRVSNDVPPVLTKKQLRNRKKRLLNKQKKQLPPKPVAKVKDLAPKRGKYPVRRRVQNFKPVGKKIMKSPISNSLISINALMDSQAFNHAYLGLCSIISSLMDNIDDSVYGYYYAALADLQACVANEVPVIKQKHKVLSAIHNGLRPKTLTRGPNSDIKFAWEQSTPLVPSKQIPIRGITYNFYKPAVADPVATPQVCVPMNIANLDEAIEAYNLNMNLLSSDKEHLKIGDSEEVKMLKYDASTFAPESPYLGQGDSQGSSLYGSGELEMVGVAIPLLGHFTDYTTPYTKRASSFLRNTAGDSCSAFTLPFLNDFVFNNLKTVHAPRIKPIYFEEIWVSYVSWLAESCQKASVLGTNVVGLPFPPLAAALGALMQTVKTYFLRSQCATQFLTPDATGQLFEGFRMAPNCAPKVGAGLMLPLPLVENLRYLSPKIYEDMGEMRHNDKNAIIYVPVIGLNRANSTWVNPMWNDKDGVPHSLFPVDGWETNINWIDGTGGGNVYNLNSKYFLGAITVLNEITTQVSTVCGSTAYLSGSPACCILPLTRLFNQAEVDLRELAKYPEWMRLPPGYVRKKISRSKSQKKEKEGDFDFLIEQVEAGGTDFLTQLVPGRVLSVSPISDELKNLMQYLILPSFIITEDGDESSQLLNADKLMIIYKEFHFAQFQRSKDTSSSTQNQFTIDRNNGWLMAPGVANSETTEYAKVINHMATEGLGGFFSDLLGVAGSIVGQFGL